MEHIKGKDGKCRECGTWCLGVGPCPGPLRDQGYQYDPDHDIPESEKGPDDGMTQ